MAKEDCPVCFEENAQVTQTSTTKVGIECPRCGRFFVSYRFMASASDERGELGARKSRLRADVSAWIRENENRGLFLGIGFLSPRDPDSDRAAFEAARVRTFHEKADRLLLAFEKKTDFAGQPLVWFKKIPELTARAWALNGLELKEIIRFLESEGRVMPTGGETQVKIDGKDFGVRDYFIGPAGWAYLEKLKELRPDSMQAFVAMPSSDEMLRVYEKALRPAIENDAKYKALLILLHEHVNRIDDEILVQIKRSRFMVADVTGQNANVTFEAGYALGLGLPVIWTCRDDEDKGKLFDIRQYNCCFWKPDDLKSLRERLAYRIEALIGKGEFIKEEKSD